MKYAIKLKDKLGVGGELLVLEPRHLVSEHTGPGNSRPVTFETMGEAEVYAQNHEIPDYEIIPHE